MKCFKIKFKWYHAFEYKKRVTHIFAANADEAIEYGLATGILKSPNGNKEFLGQKIGDKDYIGFARICMV